MADRPAVRPDVAVGEALKAIARDTLSEARAKAVTDYLGTKGMDTKLIFWEGKSAKDPVAVTKFCT